MRHDALDYFLRCLVSLEVAFWASASVLFASGFADLGWPHYVWAQPVALAQLPLLVVGIYGLMWLGLCTFAAVGFWSSRNKFAAAICIVPTLLLFTYVSPVGTNFGLVMRMRALGAPLLAPVIGLGIAVAMGAWTTRHGRSRKGCPRQTHPPVSARPKPDL